MWTAHRTRCEWFVAYVCTDVCACTFRERNSVRQITNPTAVYTSGVLLTSNGKSLVLQPKNITYSSFFEVSTLKSQFVQVYFLAGFPPTFLFHFYFSNNNLPNVFFKMRPNISLCSKDIFFL